MNEGERDVYNQCGNEALEKKGSIFKLKKKRKVHNIQCLGLFSLQNVHHRQISLGFEGKSTTQMSRRLTLGLYE